MKPEQKDALRINILEMLVNHVDVAQVLTDPSETANAICKFADQILANLNKAEE